MMTASSQQYVQTLDQLLLGLTDQVIADNIEVTGLTLDSRQVNKGDLFIARSGTQQHGANFIPAAVEAGAIAIVYEADYELQLPKISVPLISIDRLSEKIGELAHRFYQSPSNAIDVVGITGTNGKTSTAWFLAQALETDDKSVGFIGTLGKGLFGQLQSTVNTTPDAISVHKSLAEFRDAGVDYAVMEVSSHALEQYRVASVNFHSVIFTNLSHDHLDYHHSMQQYADVKTRLFTQHDSKFQIINSDDEYGQYILSQLSSNAYQYCLDNDNVSNQKNTIRAKISDTEEGTIAFELTSPWGNANIKTQLMGEFNVYNCLAVITVLGLSGLTLEKIVEKLSKLESVPGRMECFGNSENKSMVVVDYAHTPDALEKVLQSLKQQTKGWLICLFGCGGDRDQAKRAEMGKIASRYSDHIVITNDNPRSENPLTIINEIQQGIESETSVHVELDRAEAIAYAIALSKSGDIVLIAGKGHENYQIIGDETLVFDDRVWVKRFLESEGD